MKHIINFIFLFCITVASSYANPPETYRINMGAFDKINVVDNVNVVYRCQPDSAGYIVYSGDDRFADAFILSNSKGKLKIQVNTDDVDSPDLPVIYAYSDFLTYVENSSDFLISVENPCPVPKFETKLIGNGKIDVSGVKASHVDINFMTGNGKISVSGKTDKVSIKIVGTGIIQTDELEAKEVDCKIMGSGTIGCWPLDLLSVKGIGSTKIYYKGNPQIKKVGGGKLFPLSSIDDN